MARRLPRSAWRTSSSQPAVSSEERPPSGGDTGDTGGAARPCATMTSRLARASATPPSAAERKQRAASASERGRPRPRSYSTPRLNSASGHPWSAAARVCRAAASRSCPTPSTSPRSRRRPRMHCAWTSPPSARASSARRSTGFVIIPLPPPLFGSSGPRGSVEKSVHAPAVRMALFTKSSTLCPINSSTVKISSRSSESCSKSSPVVVRCARPSRFMALRFVRASSTPRPEALRNHATAWASSLSTPSPRW